MESKLTLCHMTIMSYGLYGVKVNPLCHMTIMSYGLYVVARHKVFLWLVQPNDSNLSPNIYISQKPLNCLCVESVLCRIKGFIYKT